MADYPHRNTESTFGSVRRDEPKMAIFPEERLRLKRQLSERAISLAMVSQWEEAAKVNRELLETFPEDVDAHNRLGKALTELSRLDEARAAYSRAAQLDPTNTIAQKNLQRLSKLVGEQAAPAIPGRVDPSLFIEESGKTTITGLLNTAGAETLAKMDAGDLMELRPTDHTVQVVTPDGTYVGQIEPKLSKRLISLLEAGNRYQTAVTSVDDHSVRVIIREMYRSATMGGKVSFPSKPTTEVFRGYIKDSVLKYEIDDEEDYSDEGDEGGESGPDAEASGDETMIEDPELSED
jgi:tetratricopeptide (TPR) repeat protein